MSRKTQKSITHCENYQHLLDLPLVLKLKKKIDALKKENKALLRVIVNFGEKLDDVNPIVDLSQSSDEEEEEISLLIVGKGVNKPDDEENIVYEIEEESESDKKDLQIVVKKEPTESTTCKVSFTDIKERLESVQVKKEYYEEVEEEEEEIEVEEEEEEEEEEVEEEEEEIEVEEEEEEEEEVEEEEVFEITIRGKKYFTTDTENGVIYDVTKDDDIGDELGQFVNGKAIIN